MHENDKRYLKLLKQFRDGTLPANSTLGKVIVCDAMLFQEAEDGGPGSGNFGHAGRPNQVGGSSPSGSSGGSGESSGEKTRTKNVFETISVVAGKGNYMSRPEFVSASRDLKSLIDSDETLKRERLELSRQLDDEILSDDPVVKELGRAYAGLFGLYTDKGKQIQKRIDSIDKDRESIQSDIKKISRSIEREHRLNRAREMSEASLEPLTPAKQKDYKGFTVETDVPYVQEKLDSGQAWIAEMSPKEYLERCAFHIFDESTLERTVAAVDTENVNKYADKMAAGEKFAVPYLNYTSRKQEGRHRAVAAMMNGYSKIPVVIIGKPPERSSNDAMPSDIDDGGPGSGNWGHRGRPGKVGGSGKGGGAQYRGGRSDIKYHSSKHDWLNGLKGEEQQKVTSWLKGKQHEYPNDTEEKKPIEQRIMEQGSDTDKQNLLHFMSQARSWEQYHGRMTGENLDDNERKLVETLSNKYGLDPKTGLPDDFDTSGWSKEDRDCWYDLKSKAMGGPTSGKEPPDELMYEAGLKERPKPAGPDTGWFKGTSVEQQTNAIWALQRASGLPVDNEMMTSGNGLKEAEEKAFERGFGSYMPQRGLKMYLDSKWVASGGDLSDPRIESRLTPEEYGKLRNLVLRSNMRHDQTPLDTLDYASIEERMEGYALINKALGGADVTAFVAEKNAELRKQKEEEQKRLEEERKRLEEQRRRNEEERERVKREQEQARQQELKDGISFITRNCENDKVERREVKKHDAELTSDAIITRLAGGDKTKGSCVSLSYAYAANRLGFDVLDFRGGSSQSIMSRNAGIKDVAESPGVKSTIIRSTNDITAAKQLIKTMEPGKEYLLSTGRHMAVVRMDSTGKGYEFLEMQSSHQNGWKPFSPKLEETLRARFDCKRSHTFYGQRVEHDSLLIQLDSLRGCKTFENALPYINTSPEKQMKGAGGYEK